MNNDNDEREDFAKAIEVGDSTKVESLLARGSIDVNARLPRPRNSPALVFAVECAARDVDVVEMLLSAGADIDGVDDSDLTASFAAVWARDDDVVALLLAHRPNLEIRSNPFNQTPLQFSLNYEIDTISVMLINAGASLHVDPDRLCPFGARSTAAIQALLNRGVVVNRLCDSFICTPLHAIATERSFTAGCPTASGFEHAHQGVRR
jgi:ankyrin repeat protein